MPLWKQPERPLEERIDDLVSRLSLEEKVSQMLYYAPAIGHLGIREYNWWNECLHGVARAGSPLYFPRPSAWRLPLTKICFTGWPK